MKRVIYIHGFLSSPKSFKARATKQWLLDSSLSTHFRSQREIDPQKNVFSEAGIEFVCPQLSSYPGEALQELMTLCAPADRERTFLIGSSLGGFWASYLIEQGLAERAVLINPAVSPHQRFADLVGTDIKSYYGDEIYCLRDKDVKTLAECESETLRDASRYWLMAQTGDDVLDYRDAERRYTQCKQTIENGGNHSFEGYDRYLPLIFDFFLN